MWTFLEDHYHISAPNNCGTHIHVATKPAFTLKEVKRIAQAAIHFEPAIEVLIPEHRRGNIHAQSNWLDSPNLAQKGRSRAASIAHIEKQLDRDAVVNVMQLASDVDYSWNFRSLTDTQMSTIEFRKPPSVKTGEEVLAWAEFVIAFVQASVAFENPSILLGFPPNLGGLQQFLMQLSGKVFSVSEYQRMSRLWRGIPADSWLEPIPQYEAREWSADDQKVRVTLERMMEQDKRWSRMCGKSATDGVHRSAY